ncbi:MAG: type II/IV secretion system protein [Candidatus Magasanikbacteria bacterium]|nr:type II/IV secretion system protein [Candidatus Magasanikbacteria bacterium]
MPFDNKQIAQILLAGDYITKKELSQARRIIKHQHAKLEDYLLSRNLLSKDLLGQAIAEFYKTSYINLGASVPSKEIVLKLSEKIAVKFNAILFKKEKGLVVVTTDNPKKHGLKSAIKREFKGKKIKIAFSLPEDIEGILLYYKKKLITRFSKIIKEGVTVAPDILNEIFHDAVLFGASDVHFEPEEKDVVVRFRIDGVLKEAGNIPKQFYSNVLNRIKILARLRIDEHQTIQDGGINVETGGETVNMRISIIPTIRGEKIAARILSHYVKGFTFEDLGISQENQEIIEKNAKKPFGMILVTGPTGSGKTTTLYSILKYINTPEINITTIEDPVEYRIPGINQIQVNEGKKITFSKGLRSIVRQDPDVVLVGEIRDKETVDIALNAALTGHLLLSTFHANNAASSLPRMTFMGAETFLLSSTLELIISQRLVRRICQQCKVSFTASHSYIKKELPHSHKIHFPEKSVRLYKGKGEDRYGKTCATCSGIGYSGRVGIYEFLEIDRELKSLILEKPSAQHIWRIAREKGTKSLMEDGIIKVRQGVTTLEEVMRVAGVNEQLTNKKHYEKKSKKKK